MWMILRRSLPGGLVVAALLAPVHASRPLTKPSEPAPQDPPVVTLEGCIRGASLASVRGILPDGRKPLNMYQLAGPDELLHRLTTEHDNHRVEVMGRLRDGRNPKSGARREKKIGKGRLTVGARRETPAEADMMRRLPRIDVIEFRHLSDTCGR